MLSRTHAARGAALLPVLLLLALTGCGSTVQQSSQVSAGAPGSDGLSTGSTGGSSAGVTTGQGGTSSGGLSAGSGASSGTLPGAVGGSSGTSPAGTAGTAPVAGTGATPLQGRTKVTTPIELGVLDLGSPNGAASALGAGYSTTTSGADVTKALIRYYNKHGGLSGRTIKPVEYTVQVTSGNYQTELQAACTSFTQDHKVSAVVSVLANAYYATYEQCLTKAGVPDFAGLTGTVDERDLRAYPGLVTVSSPSTNRRFTQMISRFASTGYLTPKNKIGIVVEDCPYNKRAYDDTIAPLARRLGLTVVRRDVSCIQGFADAGSAIQAFGAAVLPFRTAGVDRVLFVSNYEGVGLFAFENQASSQGYTPSYGLTSTSGGSALAGQFNDGQLHRMRGVGWAPVLDVAKRVQASSATKRCRSILASEGIVPQSKADDLVDIVCDQFFLLEAALRVTGGHATRTDLLDGVRSLRASYLSAFSLSGASDYTTRRDGPLRFAIWGYSTTCSCMDYLSAPS